MNEKGFTLVELLAVIVILSLVVVIAATSINSSVNTSKEKILEDRINNITTGAISYVQNGKNILNEADCAAINAKQHTTYDRCKVYTVQELLNLKAIETNEKGGKIYNPVTNTEMNNDIVTVYRMNNRLHAQITCKKSEGESC